jgi:ParB family transcriptional regulator, chromosome partitioning protein
VTSQTRRAPSGLGRGLASLIPQRPGPAGAAQIPIDQVRRNPYQPRQAADQQELDALARSISEHGVLQPILVASSEDGYQLIAGERRLRAAEMAGLDHVPAVIRTSVDEHARLELALIENLQRADLNPLEEARAFRRLIDEFGMTQEQVAGRVARARSSVANTLRLLDLGTPVQEALASGRVTEGHARAMAAVDDPERQAEVLAEVVDRHLTVRQTEALAGKEKAARRKQGGTPPGGANGTEGEVGTLLDAERVERERLEADLRLALGTKVTLAPGRRGGRIIVEYYDADDLGRLFERLTGVSA